MTERSESQTDAAALGGGIVAVAMTMFADPTPYDMLSLVVALTLILLLVAYLGGHRRDWPRRLAYSAVLSIIFVPVWGFVAENWKLPLWTKAVPVANESTVSDGATVAVWLVTAAIIFLLDAAWHSDRPSGGA